MTSRSRLGLLFGILVLAVAASSFGAETAVVVRGSISHESPVFSHPIHLGAGDFLRVEAVQKDANLKLAFVDAAGSVLREVDRTAPPEPEIAELVSPAEGEYQIRVSTTEPPTEKIGIDLRIDPLRPATDVDRARLAGEDLLRRGDALVNEQKVESLRAAREAYQEALADFEKASDLRQEGTALDSLGWVSDLMGEKKEALAFYERALPLRRASGDVRGELLTLQGIGLVNIYLGDYDEAIRTNEKVLELSRKEHDRKSEASILHNLGGIYWSMDEMQKALGLYGKALVIWKELGDRRGEASTLNNMGDVYRRLGDYDRALADFTRALEIRSSLDDRRGEAHSLHTIGLVYMARDEPQKALAKFEQALALRRETGDVRGEAYSLGGRGDALRELGKPAEARASLEKALAIWEKNGERRAEAETLQDLGMGYLDERDPARAKHSFEKALPISRSLGDRTYEANALYGLARVARDGNDLTGARKRIEEAIAITTSLRERITNENLRASYSSTVSRFYDFYIDLLMEMHEKTPGASLDRAAFDASERLRARTLVEMLAAADVDPHRDLDPALWGRRNELRERIASRERKRLKLLQSNQTDDVAAAVDSLEQEISSLVDDYRKVTTELLEKNPHYASLTAPKALGVNEIQSKLLDDQTALVEIQLGSERSWLWVVTRDGFETHRLASRKEIEARARHLYELLRERNRSVPGETLAMFRSRIARAEKESGKEAEALGRQVIGPAAASLQKRRLLVVADGTLQYIPFGVLSLPGP
ncbi:MAG: tetratricopeptide repeat protein, partial [Thermoanaerobaculia bacterium]